MYFLHVPKTAGTSISLTLMEANMLTPCRGRFPMHNSMRDMIDPDFSKPVVTCIRNPYDRFYSMYKYFIINSSKLKLSFEEFAKYYKEEYHDTRYYLHTQMYYVTYDDKMIATDILCFENLEEDWKKFCKKYNLNLKLKHLRKNEKESIQYSDYVKSVIEDIFADDIILWNNFAFKY